MKKDEALAWRDRIAGAVAELAPRLGGEAPRVGERLWHDEVDGDARWAVRLAPSGWPHEPGGGGLPARAGLRWEVWCRPGKAADLPLSLLLVCDGEPALAGLRQRLGPTWSELVRGGKTAGRYRLLAEAEPLALRLDRAACGLGRQVAPRWDRLEPALTQLVLDTHRAVDAVVRSWRESGEDAGLAEAPADPFSALRQRFSGGG